MSYTRRDFLRAGLGASAMMSLGPIRPGFLVRSAMAASCPPHDRDTVLVVVQLSGGNDGLNTVVPYADDEYARNRATLHLPTRDLHKIDSLLAFHPRMAAFLRLYKEGHLSVVQGVGHAHPDQSHEREMRTWHTADPERPGRQTGWLGRVVEQAWSPTEPDTAAVFVGPIGRPFALNAENVVVLSIHSIQDLILRRPSSVAPTLSHDAPRTPRDAGVSPETDDLLLQFLRQSTLDAYAKSARIEAIARAAATRPGSLESGSIVYPPFGLAENLRTIAQLIRADVGIRIFFAELSGGGIGGFDNHANQLGNHCALLHQLAESVAAFVDDLKQDKLLDRVLLMTFSEFGRTVQENGRRGTDHGAAAPMFMAGGKLKGGLVGPHPSLTDLDNGGLKFHTDFRQVYATVLDRWLGFDSTAVLGQHFEPLDILRA